MLIDSDFDNKTGYDGIDYIFQIGWNNDTKSWARNLWELSSTGEEMSIQKNLNYTGFSEIHRAYVKLSFDLNSIRHGDRYKVLFYAESKKSSSWLTDFTRWVTFPPLSINVSTLPPFLTLRPGDHKTILVKVNSTNGYEPIVYLKAIGQSGIRIGLESNKLYVPSSGMATNPLTVSAAEDALVGPYRLIISANSTLAPPQECKVLTAVRSCLFPRISYPYIQREFTIPVSIQPPLTVLQQLALGTINPQVAAGLYDLILTPIVANWLVPTILTSLTVRRQRINLHKYIVEINKLHDIPYQNKETYVSNLEMQMSKIEDGYGNGKISESQFRFLKDKISEYREEVNKSQA
jgi:hypothetical protein